MKQEDKGKKTSHLSAFGVSGAKLRTSYAEGRKNSEPTTTGRGSPTDETLARIARLTAAKKQQTYAHSRDTLIVQEVDAVLVPKPIGDNHGSASQ